MWLTVSHRNSSTTNIILLLKVILVYQSLPDFKSITIRMNNTDDEIFSEAASYLVQSAPTIIDTHFNWNCPAAIKAPPNLNVLIFETIELAIQQLNQHFGSVKVTNEVTLIILLVRLKLNDTSNILKTIQRKGPTYLYAKNEMFICNGLASCHRFDLDTIEIGHQSNDRLALPAFQSPLRNAAYRVHVLYMPPGMSIWPATFAARRQGRYDAYIFIGLDQFMLAELNRVYNVTMMADLNCGLDDLKNIDLGHERYARLKTIHPRTLLDKNIIAQFNVSSSAYATDIYQAPFYMIKSKLNVKSELEFLYPHRYDCFVILVAHNADIVSVLVRIIGNGEVQTVILVYLSFVLGRFLFDIKCRKNTFDWIWFHTIGVCLAQSTNKSMLASHNRWNTVWTAGMLVYSIIAPVILSTVIYKTLINIENAPNIVSLTELDEWLSLKNTSIYTADFLDDKGDAYLPNLKSSLANKFRLLKMGDLLNSILEHVSSGRPIPIAVQKSRIKSFLSWIRSITHRSVDDPIYHMINEPIFCGHIANRMAANSPMSEPINLFRLYLKQSGLELIYDEWFQRFNSAMDPPSAQTLNGDYEQQQSNRKLTLKQMSGIFQAYLYGMAISAVVFIVEILWNYCQYDLGMDSV